MLSDGAREAFVTSMTSSLWVGVALAGLATVIAWTRLPKQAPSHGHHTSHVNATVASDAAMPTIGSPS